MTRTGCAVRRPRRGLPLAGLLVAVLLATACSSTPRYRPAPDAPAGPAATPRPKAEQPAPPRAKAERRPRSGDARLDAVLEAARGYLGTPYHYGGTDRRGMDCSGLVWRAFRDADARELPRTSRAMHGEGMAVTRAELMPGDLVFFATSGKGVNHVGLYEGDGDFLHASSSRGVIRSSLAERYWRRCYVDARRFR